MILGGQVSIGASRQPSGANTHGQATNPAYEIRILPNWRSDDVDDKLLGEDFLPQHPELQGRKAISDAAVNASALAISTKFAISPSHRGVFATNLIAAGMYRDFLDDGIDFVFSGCALVEMV